MALTPTPASNDIQGKLSIMRSFGPRNFVCYIRYLVISVVKNNTKQSKLFHWDRRKQFVISDILLYQLSLYRVSTVLEITHCIKTKGHINSVGSSSLDWRSQCRSTQATAGAGTTCTHRRTPAAVYRRSQLRPKRGADRPTGIGPNSGGEKKQERNIVILVE